MHIYGSDIVVACSVGEQAGLNCCAISTKRTAKTTTKPV